MTDKPTTSNDPASDTKRQSGPKVPPATQAERAPIKDAGIVRAEDLPAAAIFR